MNFQTSYELAYALWKTVGDHLTKLFLTIFADFRTCQV